MSAVFLDSGEAPEFAREGACASHQLTIYGREFAVKSIDNRVSNTNNLVNENTMVFCRNQLGICLAMFVAVACSQGSRDQKPVKKAAERPPVDKALEELEKRWLADYVPRKEKFLEEMKRVGGPPWIEFVQLNSMKKVWGELEELYCPQLSDA